MKQELICRECTKALSVPLTRLEGRDVKHIRPPWTVGEPISEPGLALTLKIPFETIAQLSGSKALLNFTPCHILYPYDLTKYAKFRKRKNLLFGCCGIAGINGPNMICGCGSIIGTIKTDCFTPHVFIPNNETTKWQIVK